MVKFVGLIALKSPVAIFDSRYGSDIPNHYCIKGASKMQQARSLGLEGVSWDDVRLMAAIAEFTSLRQAAKSLGINATTLNRHVERLETGLGTAIVDRLPQGFVLNEAGQQIAAIARDMQRHFLRLQELAGGNDNAQGQVKIAITEGLGTFWVAPKLAQFTAQHPDILINMESSMDLRNPLRNEADISIQFKKPDNPDLIVSKLCNIHIYPFASVDYIAANGLPAIGQKLSHHKIVLQESDQISNSVIFEFMKKHKMPENIAFVTNSSLAHLYAVEKGLGIGGLPTFAMAMGARLVPVDVSFHHTLDLWLSYRREMRQIKRMSVAIDWLREIFNPQRYPWFGQSFMHPAGVLEVVYSTMKGQNLFKPHYFNEFIDSNENFNISNFKRKVGRPRNK
jgi:DNA-binding transcriptional LysR family regulator